MHTAENVENLSAISQLMADYFDGLYYCDVERLARVFHPSAHYSNANRGELLQLDMPTYFQIVAQRRSPASEGQQRSDRILAIEFAGPVTALVRVNCSIADKYFTDFLSLILVDGRWQIIAKVFHYELSQPQTSIPTLNSNGES